MFTTSSASRLAAAVLLCVLAVTAEAQVIGLQVADTVESRSQGDWMFTGGTVLGKHKDDFFGVRGAFSALDSLRLFADVGAVAFKHDSTGYGVQGGALCSLPVDFMSDLGVRATVYDANAKENEALGGNCLFLSSGETLLDGLFLYAGGGFDIDHKHMEDDTGDTMKTDLNGMITGGILYKLTSAVSIYAEATYVRYAYVGFGLSIR